MCAAVGQSMAAAAGCYGLLAAATLASAYVTVQVCGLECGATLHVPPPKRKWQPLSLPPYRHKRPPPGHPQLHVVHSPVPVLRSRHTRALPALNTAASGHLPCSRVRAEGNHCSCYCPTLQTLPRLQVIPLATLNSTRLQLLADAFLASISTHHHGPGLDEQSPYGSTEDPTGAVQYDGDERGLPSGMGALRAAEEGRGRGVASGAAAAAAGAGVVAGPLYGGSGVTLKGRSSMHEPDFGLGLDGGGRGSGGASDSGSVYGTTAVQLEDFPPSSSDSSTSSTSPLLHMHSSGSPYVGGTEGDGNGVVEGDPLYGNPYATAAASGQQKQQQQHQHQQQAYRPSRTPYDRHDDEEDADVSYGNPYAASAGASHSAANRSSDPFAYNPSRTPYRDDDDEEDDDEGYRPYYERYPLRTSDTSGAYGSSGHGSGSRAVGGGGGNTSTGGGGGGGRSQEDDGTGLRRRGGGGGGRRGRQPADRCYVSPSLLEYDTMYDDSLEPKVRHNTAWAPAAVCVMCKCTCGCRWVKVSNRQPKAARCDLGQGARAADCLAPPYRLQLQLFRTR